MRELIFDLSGLTLGLRGLNFGPERADLAPDRPNFGPEEPQGGRDVHMYGHMDRHLEIHPYVLQDIGPLGPLPKKE